MAGSVVEFVRLCIGLCCVAAAVAVDCIGLGIGFAIVDLGIVGMTVTLIEAVVVAGSSVVELVGLASLD